MDTPGSPQDSGLIDLSFLRVYSSGNNELMKKFINSFLERTPVAIKAMDEQLAAKDFHGLSRSAHSLKPQFSYAGMSKASELVRAIEESAKEMHDVETIPAHLDEVKSMLSRAYEELKYQLTLL
ncbi:MAG TPA: Hpt domain-containing protein [Chitinophagales bacterium]|nr:Hpt domain-containing protein [Chitinophagales bacterium]